VISVQLKLSAQCGRGCRWGRGRGGLFSEPPSDQVVEVCCARLACILCYRILHRWQCCFVCFSPASHVRPRTRRSAHAPAHPPATVSCIPIEETPMQDATSLIVMQKNNNTEPNVRTDDHDPERPQGNVDLIVRHRRRRLQGAPPPWTPS